MQNIDSHSFVSISCVFGVVRTWGGVCTGDPCLVKI